MAKNKEPSSGPRIVLWLSQQLVKALRLNALNSDMSNRKYVDELLISWISFRQEAESSGMIDIPYTYNYPYLMIPSRLDSSGEPKKGFSCQTFYLNPNTANWLQEYAVQDEVKLSTLLYTALYLGLVSPDWYKFHGRWFSLKKNKVSDWPILKDKK